MRRLCLLHRLSISDAIKTSKLKNIFSSFELFFEQLINTNKNSNYNFSPSIIPKKSFPITALAIYPQQGDIYACSGCIFVRWNVNGELLCCDRFGSFDIFFFCFALFNLYINY
jgi:hypothetical protein